MNTKISIREDYAEKARGSLTTSQGGKERTRDGNWLPLDDEFLAARYVGNMTVAIAWAGLGLSLAILVGIVVMGGLNLG